MRSMKAADFDIVFDLLTPMQRRVLQQFLAGGTDEAIATTLYLKPSLNRRSRKRRSLSLVTSSSARL